MALLADDVSEEAFGVAAPTGCRQARAWPEMTASARHFPTATLATAGSAFPPAAGPELSIVAPTFNERQNAAVLVDPLARLLTETDWEVVFVDDDSPDGTAEHLLSLPHADRRIRCIRRLGRRGLSSARIEGILSTSARFPISDRPISL